MLCHFLRLELIGFSNRFQNIDLGAAKLRLVPGSMGSRAAPSNLLVLEDKPSLLVDEVYAKSMKYQASKHVVCKSSLGADLPTLDQLPTHSVNGLAGGLLRRSRCSSRRSFRGLHSQGSSQDELPDRGGETGEEGIERLSHVLALWCVGRGSASLRSCLLQRSIQTEYLPQPLARP